MKSAVDVLGGDAVAVIGAGLVGMGWAVVFARAGINVRMYDTNEAVLKAAPDLIHEQLKGLEQHGLLSESPLEVLRRISPCSSLESVLAGAAYVQESILERVDLKRQLMEDLQRYDDGKRIVGSSTSGIPASKFTQGMEIAPRVVIVHPVNPPSLVPLVELVPSPETSKQTLDFARELMTAVKQTAITVHREIEGFVLNRLQAVLLREAWALVEDGIVSAEDLDKTVRDGLGWRWSFMGPFETIHLNAVGGVADYAARLGPLYRQIAASRTHETPWGEDLIASVEAQMLDRVPLAQLVERCQWRDRQLMAFARHRDDVKHAGSDSGINEPSDPREGAA
jgi:3-hydroxyacyl-CoA dehydrogenase